MATSVPRTRRPRRAALSVAVALVAVVLAACTSAPSPTGPTQTAATPKTLTIGATIEPTSMDPTADAAAAGSQVMLYNVYETLVKLDAEGRLRPLLAQAWDVSSDRLTYTFRLNPAAKFADGTKVTAEAVAANVERIRTGTVAAKLKNSMAVVTGTRVVDPETLEVTLARPSVNWLYDMASTAGMVINPLGFDNAKAQTAGSGPLALKQWKTGDSIVLAKNPAYWGTPVRFDEVTFRYIADPNAMNASMLSGQLDVISNLQAPDALAQFSDTARYSVTEGTTNGEVVLGVNNSSPALGDPRVRRALTMAIDKRALVQTVWGGKGVVIGSMAVPTDPYFEDLTGLNPYDPAKAKQLLAEAGQPNLTVRLKPAAIPYATRAAQFVASQLQAVGVTVQLEELQFPARWLDTVYTKADYDLTIVAHVEARDIVTFTNKDYYWRYSNPAFNDLVAKADAGTTDSYATDMKAASRVLAEDAAAIWLFVLPNLIVTRAGITGVSQNATSLSFDVTTIAAA